MKAKRKVPASLLRITFLGIGIFLAASATNEAKPNSNDGESSSLVLSIPEDTDFPREQLNLTIHLPGKIQPSREARDLSRKIIKKRYDFESHPFRKVSSRSRFRSIMSRFARKGVLVTPTDVRQAQSRAIPLLTVQAGRLIIQVYKALLKIEGRQELRKFRIRNQDIVDLKEMVDEFQKDIKMFTYNPTTMHSQLDRLLKKANKTTGKGAIRITGVSESDDGTLINLYIKKE
ncbi:hypothetical protein HOF92_06125 [bacterium]|jgi:hypothetical protein|nr:hypothetical protein [bacterium]